MQVDWSISFRSLRKEINKVVDVLALLKKLHIFAVQNFQSTNKKKNH